MMKYRSSQTTVPERIYNPITTVGFSAMFTFQLDNTKSNQVTLITDKPVHTTQNPEFFSEYEFDSLKF